MGRHIDHEFGVPRTWQARNPFDYLRTPGQGHITKPSRAVKEFGSSQHEARCSCALRLVLILVMVDSLFKEKRKMQCDADVGRCKGCVGS